MPLGQARKALVSWFVSRSFLAQWARKLSWDEVALSFHVSWADVYASVQWVVDYGLKHRVLGNVQAIGIDEICVRI